MLINRFNNFAKRALTQQAHDPVCGLGQACQIIFSQTKTQRPTSRRSADDIAWSNDIMTLLVIIGFRPAVCSRRDL